MKKLILLRHAKSSWDDPDLDDHDRPLNKRGRRSAPAIAGWLGKRGHRPDVVLCSSAERARETFALLREAMPDLPEPLVEQELYHAAPARLRDRLAKLDAGDVAMLIGHQPGLGAFLRKLSDGSARPRCARAYEHFPTAAAAVVEFDIPDWQALAFGSGRFTEFAVPRELMEK